MSALVAGCWFFVFPKRARFRTRPKCVICQVCCKGKRFACLVVGEKRRPPKTENHATREAKVSSKLSALCVTSGFPFLEFRCPEKIESVKWLVPIFLRLAWHSRGQVMGRPEVARGGRRVAHANELNDTREQDMLINTRARLSE